MNQFVTNTKNVIRGKYHPEFLQNEVLAYRKEYLILKFLKFRPPFEIL